MALFTSSVLDELWPLVESLHEGGKGDLAIALDGFASLDVAKRAVEKLFAGGDGSSTFTVSLVRVRGGAEAPEDLLGDKPGAICGVPVSTASDALATWKLARVLAHDSTTGGTGVPRDVVATVTVRPQLQRLHLVRFLSPGLWSSRGGLPERLRDKCRCALVTSDDDECDDVDVDAVGSVSLVAEWRHLFGLSQRDAVVGGNVETELQAARARIAVLEAKLRDAQERIALRETTLVNVLLGSHPAFDGLTDAQAKQSAKKSQHKPQQTMKPRTMSAIPLPAPLGKENAADANHVAMVGFHEQPLPVKSMGSTGGALRVVKTPGARQKTKSRVF